MELLSLSIGVGLAVGLVCTELFGIASGGLIVPGYVALFLTRPWDVVATVVVGFATFAIVRVLSTFLIVYGRRRTALMILIGYVLGMALRQIPAFGGIDVSAIGFIIPGLIAVWMDRQGVLQTVSSMLIVSVIVRLVLVLVVGGELVHA